MSTNPVRFSTVVKKLRRQETVPKYYIWLYIPIEMLTRKFIINTFKDILINYENNYIFLSLMLFILQINKRKIFLRKRIKI